MKWVFALVLVLVLAGSAGAMAQEQMQQQTMEQNMENQTTTDEQEDVTNTAVNTTANRSTGGGSSALEGGEGEPSEDVGEDSDTSTAGETQTETRTQTEAKKPVTVISARERISERLREKIQKYTDLKDTSLTQEQRMIKLKEQLHTRIQNARHATIEAANKYSVAKQNYLEAKKHGIAPVQAKTMLHTGSNYMEKWLDRIELAVINSDDMDEETKLAILDRIDEYRTEIADKKAKLNGTEDIAEMREIARELNDYWREVRLFIQSVVYQLAAEKLENIIEKADDVTLRIQEKIEEMKAAGEDTSKLEDLLADYEENIELARENVEEAKEILFNATTAEEIREGHKLITDASRYLKDAFKDVRLMSKEYRQGKIFYGNATGEIFIRGDGEAVIQGSGIVVAKGNGSIVVDPDSAVKAATGFGAKSTGNGVTEIKGRGVVVVRGEDIKVTIEGTDLQIFAKGTGSVYLKGTGTYKVKKLPTTEMTEEEYDGELTVDFGGE